MSTCACPILSSCTILNSQVGVGGAVRLKRDGAAIAAAPFLLDKVDWDMRSRFTASEMLIELSPRFPCICIAARASRGQTVLWQPSAASASSFQLCGISQHKYCLLLVAS